MNSPSRRPSEGETTFAKFQAVFSVAWRLMTDQGHVADRSRVRRLSLAVAVTFSARYERTNEVLFANERSEQ